MPRFESVAELLPLAQKKLQLTQEQLAKGIGVKLSRVQEWAAGVSEPHFNIRELRRIRKFRRQLSNTLIDRFVLYPYPKFPLPNSSDTGPLAGPLKRGGKLPIESCSAGNRKHL